ncbi:MAG: Mrp/NBP35 family ATP-binding protein [Thermoplasmatota archaeon]
MSDAPKTPTPLPMSGAPAPGQPGVGGAGGPVDPRAAERLKRRMRIIQKMKGIKHKFIVASGKGGVGKSTVATNLAASLAAQGHKVGLLDMDLTGPNVPKMLGIEDGELVQDENGLKPVEVTENLKVISMQFLLPDPDSPVIWRGPIKMQIIGQFLGDVNWGELDYLIVDLPPGSSDEPLSVAQNIPDADGVVLVTTPQDVAVGDVRKSVRFVQRLELPVLGVIENMSGLRLTGRTEPGTTVELDTGAQQVQATAGDDGSFTVELDLFKRGGGRAMAEAMETAFLGEVPLDLAVLAGGDAGKPFILQEGDSPAKAAFDAIVATLVEAGEKAAAAKAQA